MRILGVVAFLVSGVACHALEDHVADDMVAQYELSKKGGNAAEICVHAGLVSAAYLQAKNEPKYLEWKKTEKSDCAKAGIPQ